LKSEDFRKLIIVAWVVVLVGSTAMAIVMKELSRRQRQDWAAFTRLEQAQNNAGRALQRRIAALSHKHPVSRPGTGLTREELEREITGGQPMPISSATQSNGVKYEQASYVDPTSNWRFTFQFLPSDGRWGGYSARSQGTLATPPRMPSWTTPWHAARSYAVGIAGILYIALLIGGCLRAASRRGSRLIHGSLLLGVLVIGLAEAHSGYPAFSTSNDKLWIGVFMTVASAGVLMVTLQRERRWRKQKVEERICLVCGYDLRASPERCPECGTPVPSRTSLVT
jgi:hypothetical protein